MSAPMPLVSSSTRERVHDHGRWGGSVTHHALPDSTEEIEALDVALRRRLAAIWLTQAATEARVARSFGVIHESLERLGADPALVTLAARAVDDEHRHAALCEEMAGRYAGQCCGPHPELPTQRPEHATASPELRDALYVVGQCALNETFASAYLSAARQGATSPLARAALRELLEDEIDHARVGWAYLSLAPESIKNELSEWLVPITACNLREWRSIELPDDDSLAAYGIPPAALVSAELTAALEGVLLPGFRHVGLDTNALVRWIDDGARLNAAQ